MKKIVVKPLFGFGEVVFGDSRNVVRKKLGSYSEFKKNCFSVNTTDDFGFCQVYYDNNDTVEAVEFITDIQVQVGDAVIFPGTLSNAKETFPDLADEEGALISKKQSVGIIIDEDENIESILFGRKNYYI